MSRMLADRDSTDLHLNLSRRHQRLARRYKQAALVAAIQTSIDGLAARQSTSAEKELDRQGAYDDVQAADGDLDDAIRNLFSGAESFDRDHLGAGTLAILFPSGGFGTMIELEVAQEPDAAEALAIKVETLGTAHTLAPHGVKLKTLAAIVREALSALNDAVRAAKNAQAEEEIAQGTLRRQYESNYLTARQSLGRGIAERIFPGTNRSQANEPTPPPAVPAIS